jgi:hypothetical protein
MLLKVSFDFDSTLSREDVQDFTKDLVKRGFDIWITTSRIDTESALENGWWWIKSQNEQLYEVAEECGIKKENIQFTNMKDKIEVLKNKNFLFHLDDDEVELDLIKASNDSCIPVWVELKNWKEICENIIKNGNTLQS